MPGCHVLRLYSNSDSDSRRPWEKTELVGLPNILPLCEKVDDVPDGIGLKYAGGGYDDPAGFWKGFTPEGTDKRR